MELGYFYKPTFSCSQRLLQRYEQNPDICHYAATSTSDLLEGSAAGLGSRAPKERLAPSTHTRLSHLTGTTPTTSMLYDTASEIGGWANREARRLGGTDGPLGEQARPALEVAQLETPLQFAPRFDSQHVLCTPDQGSVTIGVARSVSEFLGAISGTPKSPGADPMCRRDLQLTDLFARV